MTSSRTWHPSHYDNSIEFGIDYICFHYSLKKTDPITKIFCTFQDSYVVLEFGKFHCDRLDVRDVNICTLIEYEISSKFLKWDEHLIHGLSGCDLAPTGTKATEDTTWITAK